MPISVLTIVLLTALQPKIPPKYGPPRQVELLTCNPTWWLQCYPRVPTDRVQITEWRNLSFSRTFYVAGVAGVAAGIIRS